MGIKPVDLRNLKAKAENIYEAVVISAQEARRINEETKTEFTALMNTFLPNADDDFDDRDNAEQEKLSLEFEKREKPHMQALDKMAKGEVEFRYKEVEE